jgi:putative phosphoesterase
MVRYLIIGDSHIPRRAKDVPEEIYNKITELTTTEQFEYTFFTGDLIKAPKFLDFLNLKTIKEVFVVIGNMDYFDGNRNAPLYQKLDIQLEGGVLTIGLTHGAQISPRGDHAQLELLAAERGYHILISGHTHHEEVLLTGNGTLLLNPGSVTGAWSFVASGIPCFITLNIEEKSKEIKINLFQFNKKSKEINEVRSFFIFQNDRIKRF